MEKKPVILNPGATCNGCKFAIYEDFGYSNYTVEGTDFSCAMGSHPDGTFDRFYGKAKELVWAEFCPKFEAGCPICMDVEGEGVAELTPDERVIWYMYQKS